VTARASHLRRRQRPGRIPARGERPLYQLILELDRAHADPLAGLDPRTRRAWRESAIEWRANPESTEYLEDQSQ
jgi:hypothetical protein